MKRYIKEILFTLLAISTTIGDLSAQTALEQLQPAIALKNPSFEQEPQVGSKYSGGPIGWHDCGFQGETAPDIHPEPDSAFFEVVTKASDGNTYLGMVVRDNQTWEAVGQRLRNPMIGGKCYNFSINLARSSRYVSLSRNTDKTVNYEKAAVLRVWGGTGYCSKLELLDETETVTNYEWRTYNLRLEPSRHYSFIMLEVFYKTPVMFEYNGNMLLDNASELIPVACDEAPEPPIEDPKQDVVINMPPVKPINKQRPSKPDVVPDKPDNKTTGNPAKKKKEYVGELDEDLVIGQEITLKKLYFDADSSTLAKKYFPIVNDVYDFLMENRNVMIEIGGHTNSRCEDDFCNRLSEDRAKSVANYLVNKGIMANRVKYKGYGKTNPKYPNNTPTNRRRNQRVDIKILSKNG